MRTSSAGLRPLVTAALNSGRLTEVDALVRDLLGPDVANEMQRAVTDHLLEESGDPDAPEQPFPLLADLLRNPELLKPPPAVVPRLAYRGRAAALIGLDKIGKSWIAAEGVAAVTAGRPWLGERVEQGRAVVVAPDEAIGDTVRRLHELGADPTRVRVLALRPPALLEALSSVLADWPADLVVVDSLTEWARLVGGTIPDNGDAAGWGAIVRPLVGLSREHDTGLQVLHHARRSDGEFRGSGEIAAAFDCLTEMVRPTEREDATLRRFRVRARWNVEGWAARFVGGRYELAEGELSLDARVLLYVERDPGATTTEIRQNVTGRASEITAALERLEARGALMDAGSGGGHAWWPGGSGESSGGTGPERDGNDSGTGTEAGAVPGGPPVGGEPPPGTRPTPDSGGTAEDLERDLDRALGGAA